MDSATEDIERVLENRLSLNSRKNYVASLKFFKKWLVDNGHNECVRDDEIVGAALSVRIVQTFLADQQNRSVECEDGEKKAAVGISRLKSYRSAIRYLLQEQGVPGFEEFISDLKLFFAGLKRIDAQSRRNGTSNVNRQEGKEKLPFGLYRTLCHTMLCGSERNLWGHCYAVLSWNLMCRTNNTADIHLERLSWMNDALGIYFAVTKTDQAGIR